MAASIVRNHAEAILREEEHLSVPHVGVQRPAVRKRHDRALAPVLVVDLRAILRGDRAHGRLSLWPAKRKLAGAFFQSTSCAVTNLYPRHRGGSLFAGSGDAS